MMNRVLLCCFRRGGVGLGLVFLVCFCSARVAVARINETEAACDMRYNHGQMAAATLSDKINPLITGSTATNKTFSYQGWQIRIGFIRSYAARLNYRKQGSLEKITTDEVQAILNSNGGVKSWRLISLNDYKNPPDMIKSVFQRANEQKVWYRKDGCYAYRYAMGSIFRIENNHALLADEALKKPKPRAIPAF